MYEGKFKWKFSDGSLKDKNIRDPYAFILNTTSNNKPLPGETGQVHGRVQIMSRGECKENVIATGFAIMSGVTKYTSSSLQYGPYSDGYRHCTQIEMQLVDRIVEAWKANGPGHTIDVENIIYEESITTTAYTNTGCDLL